MSDMVLTPKQMGVWHLDSFLCWIGLRLATRSRAMWRWSPCYSKARAHLPSPASCLQLTAGHVADPAYQCQ